MLGKFAFQLLNGVGDYITLRDVLNPEGRPNWDKMTEDEILTKVHVYCIIIHNINAKRQILKLLPLI